MKAAVRGKPRRRISRQREEGQKTLALLDLVGKINKQKQVPFDRAGGHVPSPISQPTGSYLRTKTNDYFRIKQA